MIKIEIERKTRQVNIDKSLLGNDNENLQDNLEFSFLDEFVNGQARLELKFKDNQKTFITLEKVDETYTTPVTNVMTVQGKVYAQLVITEGTDEESIPLFKSNIFYFYVNESINAETGDREPYIEWIDKANIKLNQMDNLNIEAEKQEHTTTITVTRKDGTSYQVEVLDGEKGEKGDTGAPGAIKWIMVDELPTQSIQVDAMYLVPKDNPDTKDIYDEYVYVDNDWERLGERQIQVDLTDYYTKQETYSKSEVNSLIPDLTDYVKNTDYASSSKGGVFKTNDNLGTNVRVDGMLQSTVRNYATYTNDVNYLFISKGTLENVIAGKELVNKTYVDTLVGDISSALDSINGEVI